MLKATNDLKIAISKALFTPVDKQRLVTNQQPMHANTIICAGTTVFLAVIPNEVYSYSHYYAHLH